MMEGIDLCEEQKQFLSTGEICHHQLNRILDDLDLENIMDSCLNLEMVEFALQDLVIAAVSQVMIPSKGKGVRIIDNLSEGFMAEAIYGNSVTRDGCPIIFHDDFILTEEAGNILEKWDTDLSLEEFLSYGPQNETGKVGKTLLRKMKDGRVFNWNVESDAPFCTLQEVFQRVDSSLGFNIELKFDDNIVYQEEELTHVLQSILQVVFDYANERPIFFSSFQPDAAQLMRKLQSVYPVLFLTNGGNEIYTDARRNSLDEAIKLCLTNGLQGIVSEVRGVFRNPTVIPRIKESNLAILTYGQLNNVPEAVYMQHLMGINGVIVDLVQEITEAVSDFQETKEGVGEGKLEEETSRPNFSQRELSFLLKLIPELVQH